MSNPVTTNAFDADSGEARDQTTLGRIGRRMTSALYVVGGTAVLVLMLYVVANALSRTMLRAPLPNSLEIVQFIFMPLLSCLGFVAATIAHRHVTADILYDLFPAAGKKWLVFGNLVLTAAMFGVLVVFTGKFALFAIERNFKAGFTDIPSWPLIALVPVTFLISGVLIAQDAWREARTPVEAWGRQAPKPSTSVDGGVEL